VAIPSGSGTEVLSMKGGHAINNASWSIGTVASGATHNIGVNHILTILSITICNLSATATNYDILINDGSNDIRILSNSGNARKLGGYETFVWNDRLIIPSGCKLEMHNEANEFDWSVSYIDQNWID